MSIRLSSSRIVAVAITLASCGAMLAAIVWMANRRVGLPPVAVPAAKKPVVQIAEPDGMVLVPAGKFLRGSNSAASADARPAHAVRLDAYWIDTHEVTNDAFARFVDATGYRTTAEELGHSYVFNSKQTRWDKTKGADWRHPAGPEDKLSTKGHWPVVHVSWLDATAYALWSGRRLPTEAEWEKAARGSIHDAPFPWGMNELVAGERQANYWTAEKDSEGEVEQPRQQSGGQYPPNGLGLYDVAGNVWEWCGDWYAADVYQLAENNNPRGTSTGSDRVARGGSWVGSSAGAAEITVHHRGHFPPAFSANHLGFRCAKDVR